MVGPIGVWGFKLEDNFTRGFELKTFFGNSRPSDVSAEHFEFSPFPRLAINGCMKRKPGHLGA